MTRIASITTYPVSYPLDEPLSDSIHYMPARSALLLEVRTEGGEVGKKLDFLMQEMNREANTILAKTAGLGTLGLTITAAGLATKAEVEKIREQALNLE